MTISSATNKSGPYTGDGANTSFTYGFKVYNKADIAVIKTVVATGVETVLAVDVDYTVNNVGEDPPGNTITMSTAPAATETITLILDLDFLQEVDLENQGGYYPDVVERALDLAVQRDLQLEEELNRAVKVDASSSTDPSALLDDVSAQAAAAAASAAAASTSETNAGTSETNASTSETNAAASASTASAAQTAAEAAQTAAEAAQTGAEAVYDDFDDRYLGPKASAPSVDNDGAALVAGALYFNTTDDNMYTWNGSAWQLSVSGTYVGSTVSSNLTVGHTTDIETLGSNTITPDFQVENLKSRAVTGNVTINAPTTGNGVCHIKLAADASGPYTITLGTGVTAVGAIPDLAASTTYIATVMRFGTGDAYCQITETG